MFIANPACSDSEITKVASANPLSPFCTPGYISYRRALGFEPWTTGFGTDDGNDIVCFAFLKSGRIRKSLELPSMPAFPADHPYWPNLAAFCETLGITSLHIHSFGAAGGIVPRLYANETRKRRWEYVLHLSGDEFFRKIRKGHSYSIKRSRKAGTVVRRACNSAAIETHGRLINASMQRRQARGENVSTETEMDAIRSIVHSGAGEIFQAVLDEQVLSSNVILLSEKAGYNHTQGTSTLGMECGAAQFLIFEIACALREEGKLEFNLGGTDQLGTGLEKFKTGFGMTTEQRALEAVNFTLRGPADALLHRFGISRKYRRAGC